MFYCSRSAELEEKEAALGTALEQKVALEVQLAAAAEAAAALSAAKADLEAALAQTQAALQSSQDRCDAAEVRSTSDFRFLGALEILMHRHALD